MPAHRTRMILAVALLAGLSVARTEAYSSYFTTDCAGCHTNDTPTCNGCHYHRGAIHAAADAPSYAPGATVTVTLSGGTRTGWIRGLLYDQNGVRVALATGPTGTGDDGLGHPVVFPVALQAPAPLAPGDYTWQAAWFGNSDGSGHAESRVSVTIHVLDTAAVPEAPPLARALSISPNPVRDIAALRFDAGPAGERVSLAILEVSGRRVRRLWNASIGPGAQQIVWDGTDDAGLPVASGTYFVLLAGEAGQVVRSLEVMR
jgi:hypothetical protein